jgi:hypothetical protein
MWMGILIGGGSCGRALAYVEEVKKIYPIHIPWFGHTIFFCYTRTRLFVEA